MLIFCSKKQINKFETRKKSINLFEIYETREDFSLVFLIKASKMYYLDTSKMKKCDILLTTTQCFFSKVIRLVTSSDISHASLVVDPHVLIDSTSEGVQSRNIHRLEYDDKSAVHLMRLKQPLSDEQKVQIERFARSFIGMRYNTFDAAVAGLHQLGAIKKTPQEKRMFCSRLVAEAFASAGIKLVEEPSFCTPEELLQSPLLEEIVDISIMVANEGFVSVKELGRDFDQEMRDATKYIVEKAEKIDSSICDLNGMFCYLINHPECDSEILQILEESGYLTQEDELYANSEYLYDSDKYIQFFKSNAMQHCIEVSNREDFSRFKENLEICKAYEAKYHLKTFSALKMLYEKLYQHAVDRKKCALEVLNKLKPQGHELCLVLNVDDKNACLQIFEDGEKIQVNLSEQIVKQFNTEQIKKDSLIYAQIESESEHKVGISHIAKLY